MKFVSLEEVSELLDGVEEESAQDVTDAEIAFVEEGWSDGAQCRSCGRSALDGVGGLCMDCEVDRPRKLRAVR